MSDLDERISAWRVSLGQRLEPKAVDELEDHLRTMIDSLAPTGLPEAERLLLASHRLGHPDALSAEFAKTNPFAIWRERLAWMLVGLVPVHLLLSNIESVANNVGTRSLNWGCPAWAAASAIIASQALMLLAILTSCLWVGKATRPVRWTPPRLLPASFVRLAGLLVMMVVALDLNPMLIGILPGRGVDAAHLREFNDLLLICGMGWSWLYLAFYVVAAVLVAWLMTSRRAETEAAST